MDLLVLAYRHGSDYGGWTDWMAHIALSSIIHGLVYSLIFKVMHRLTLGEAVGLVVVALVVLFMWSRSREQRRW